MELYTPESVYRLDQAAVERDRFSEVELMQRAGERVWRELIARWPDAAAISVFAGAGNNGGDAFVVALCARARGIDVQLLVQGDLARQSPTSAHFKAAWQRIGGTWEDWQQQELRGDVIVDGLLGIGLERELDADWQVLIETINRSLVPKLAIDIPSGLSGLTGVAQPVAVRADLTVTFIGAKIGQYLADGPDYCGELVFDDLGVSRQTRNGVPADLGVIESCQLPPPRRRNSHKNQYGHVLVVGGDRGMSGAVALAAHAALRSGAGLVTALVHPDCRHSLAAVPEIMVLDWDALARKLEQADVIVVGPGLGDSAAAGKCLQKLSAAELPMVADAGALKREFLQSLKSRQVVITPHPGEAAALLEKTTGAIQSDRVRACRALVKACRATCVLKGSGTLIADAERIEINLRGNPGMASAGMGDVLSGIIAAMLAQGLEPYAAARSAVFLHALGAEMFAEEADETGLLASDIIARIPGLVRRLRDGE